MRVQCSATVILDCCKLVESRWPSLEGGEEGRRTRLDSVHFRPFRTLLLYYRINSMLTARGLLLCTAVLCSLTYATTQQQQPLMASSSPSLPNLAAILTRTGKASIYYDYARDSHISSLLSPPLIGHSSPHSLLVPINSAILSLSRKPHQGPPTHLDHDGTIISNKALGDSKQEEQQRAEWLEQWVKLHIIDGQVDLDAEGWEDRAWPTLVEGREVSFAKSGGKGEGRKVMPGDVEIVGVEQVSAGLACCTLT